VNSLPGLVEELRKHGGVKPPQKDNFPVPKGIRR